MTETPTNQLLTAIKNKDTRTVTELATGDNIKTEHLKLAIANYNRLAGISRNFSHEKTIAEILSTNASDAILATAQHDDNGKVNGMIIHEMESRKDKVANAGHSR